MRVHFRHFRPLGRLTLAAGAAVLSAATVSPTVQGAAEPVQQDRAAAELAALSAGVHASRAPRKLLDRPTARPSPPARPAAPTAAAEAPGNRAAPLEVAAARIAEARPLPAAPQPVAPQPVAPQPVAGQPATKATPTPPPGKSRGGEPAAKPARSDKLARILSNPLLLFDDDFVRAARSRPAPAGARRFTSRGAERRAAPDRAVDAIDRNVEIELDDDLKREFLGDPAPATSVDGRSPRRSPADESAPLDDVRPSTSDETEIVLTESELADIVAHELPPDAGGEAAGLPTSWRAPGAFDSRKEFERLGESQSTGNPANPLRGASKQKGPGSRTKTGANPLR